MSIGECIAATGMVARIDGDAGIRVLGVSRLEEASQGMLAFCSASVLDVPAKMAGFRGNLVILREGADVKSALASASEGVRVFSSNPMLLFARCVQVLMREDRAPGVDPSSRIDPTAQVGANPTIEPFVAVERDCRIGDHVIIRTGSVIAAGSSVGNQVIVEANATIGSAGLAFGEEDDGSYHPLIHLGSVTLEDNVHIGAGCVVARGILEDTRIGKGSKIGNGVNIGHNVQIGENCFIATGVTLCGSARIESGAWLAPGAVVLNHVVVGRNAKVSLGAIVTKNVADNTVVAGSPARFVGEWRKDRK